MRKYDVDLRADEKTEPGACQWFVPTPDALVDTSLGDIAICVPSSFLRHAGSASAPWQNRSSSASSHTTTRTSCLSRPLFVPSTRRRLPPPEHKVGVFFPVFPDSRWRFEVEHSSQPQGTWRRGLPFRLLLSGMLRDHPFASPAHAFERPQVRNVHPGPGAPPSRHREGPVLRFIVSVPPVPTHSARAAANHVITRHSPSCRHSYSSRPRSSFPCHSLPSSRRG